MTKHHHYLLLFVALLLCCSSCKKDNLTEMLSGTYIVSGNDPYDSTIASINNAGIQVQKEDKDRLKVSFYSLPEGTELILDYDENISDVYYFRGGLSGPVELYDFAMFFYKSNPDSVYISYGYQDSIPATIVYDYRLHGRKQ